MPRTPRRELSGDELERVKAMARATYKRYRAANLEKLRAAGRAIAKRRNARPEMKLRAKNLVLKRKYGITLQQYEEMFDAQGGLCAICRHPETATDNRTGKCRTMSVDHCHTTGGVRELLCGKCNAMIGYARENPWILRAGIEYIERHKAKVAA